MIGIIRCTKLIVIIGKMGENPTRDRRCNSSRGILISHCGYTREDKIFFMTLKPEDLPNNLELHNYGL